MTHGTIRCLELWLGRPLCALLTAHRRISDWFGSHQPGPARVRRILFIKLIEQGSTVLAYGALHRAVEMVGRSNVYYCVFADNREIVDVLGVIPPGNVITIRSEKPHWFLLDSLRALAQMRRIDIDAAIDMEYFARASAILAYLSGAARRVGLHRFTSEGPYRGDLMTHRIAHNPYLHTARAFHLLVHALTLDPRDVPLLKLSPAALEEALPRFDPREEERRSVRRLLNEAAGCTVDGPIVLLNPNADDRLPLRKWPTERFVELARRVLADHPNVTLVIMGAPGERDAAERVRLSISSAHVVNLAGLTTLRDAMVLYSLADVLITNDSGPAHFASMTDAEVVVLFGPETPQLYSPLGSRTHVVWEGLACSPCVNAINNRFSPCRNNICMQSITVEQVYGAVAECLATRIRSQKNAVGRGGP